MYAVKAAHDITVHHVDHRLGHRVIDTFVGEYTLLDDQVAHRLVAAVCGSLGARTLGQVVQVFHVAHRHHPHAIGTVVGLDDGKRLLVDAVFLVLAAGFGEHLVHLGRQRIHAGAVGQTDSVGLGKNRVDEPGVDTDQLAKTFGQLFVTLEVAALAAHCPAGVQWWQQVLFM